MQNKVGAFVNLKIALFQTFAKNDFDTHKEGEMSKLLVGTDICKTFMILTKIETNRKIYEILLEIKHHRS